MQPDKKTAKTIQIEAIFKTTPRNPKIWQTPYRIITYYPRGKKDSTCPAVTLVLCHRLLFDGIMQECFSKEWIHMQAA